MHPWWRQEWAYITSILGTGQKPPDKEHFYFLEENFANFWYFNGILYVIVVQMYTQLFQSTKLIKLNFSIEHVITHLINNSRCKRKQHIGITYIFKTNYCMHNCPTIQAIHQLIVENALVQIPLCFCHE